MELRNNVWFLHKEYFLQKWLEGQTDNFSELKIVEFLEGYRCRGHKGKYRIGIDSGMGIGFEDVFGLIYIFFRFHPFQ